MRLWFLVIVGVLGCGILVWLGVWQVQRLAEKEDLLARIEGQITAKPVDVRSATRPDFQRYAPVEVTGTFGAPHIRMLASRKTVGAVYRIIRPFEVSGFGPVLIDTGWITDDQPVPAAPEGALSLVGNLDAPNEADGFTPAPDIDAGLWFARDVPAMADTLNTQPILIVVRDAPETDLGVTPWPVDTAGIPNDHLQYAITWFSLALIWGAMTAYFLLRTSRSPR